MRRGRRGQHTRPPSWDGYRGSGWGMARADTSSFGGRYQNPSPNQPVPFYRAPRYPGPQNQQFRSYADVARPRYQRPARRWGSPRARDPGVQREAAEPAFGSTHSQGVWCNQAGAPSPERLPKTGDTTACHDCQDGGHLGGHD